MPTIDAPKPLGGVAVPALESLRQRFGKRFSQAAAVRDQHAGLEGHHQQIAPEGVCFAENADEVAALVRWCHEQGVPIIPHGAGTSLEGHLAAPSGGISLDLTAMNRIIEVDSENLLCRVETGVTREQLNHYLRDLGLFFPIDPGANATLGGMASTRASGTNAVRYGTMRENVRSLQAVLPDGSVIETGRRAAKSAAGYDLTALFVGSEGTLGVITELTLRLYGIPEHIVAGTCAFASFEGAVATVISAMQMGLSLARIELVDEYQIRACNAYSQLDLPEQPTLFLEFHGSKGAIQEQTDAFGAIARENGGDALEVATRVEDRSRLWKARHDAYFAAKAVRPGASAWATDVCVPIASLADSILATRRDIAQTDLTAMIVGHVGDGNYHVIFLLDPDQPAEWDQAESINQRMVERAIALGGTCTGEHGIGIGKRDKLLLERGDGVRLMATLKHAIDPGNIMNPGKIFL